MVKNKFQNLRLGRFLSLQAKVSALASVGCLIGVIAVTLTVGLTEGCTKQYQVHPGSINTFDSQTADTLLQAKTLLDSSRRLITPKTAPIWTALAKAYDTAYPSYEAYRSIALKGGDPSTQQAALQKSLNELTKAVASFKAAGGVK